MTSIPPSTPVASASTSSAASASAAPAIGTTAVLTQLPDAVRLTTPGTVITGTVVGRDNHGQILLQTDSGVIGLRTAAHLAVGSQITLQLQAAGSQLQAVLLAAVAPRTGAAAPAPTARASPASPTGAPAATFTVSSGPVLTATVISPNIGGPLPSPTPTAAPPSVPQSPGTSAAASPSGRTATAPPPGGAAPALAPASGGALPPASLLAHSVQTASPSISSAVASYSATPGASPSVGAPASAGAAAAKASVPPAAPGTTPSTAAAAPGAATAAHAGAPSSPTASAAQQTAPAPAAPGPSAPTPPLHPAASGTTIQLRLIGALPTTPLGPNQIAGTLVGYVPGGQAIVDTLLGRLAVPLPHGAAPPSAGSALLFELFGFGARATGADPAGAMPALGREWPALKSAMTALAEIDLPLARQILEVTMPRLGHPRFLGQILRYLAMPATEAGALLGETAVARLERAGRHDLVARLEADLREMSRLNSHATDWRVFYVPVLETHELRQLRIFTRRRKSGKDKSRDGGRFVVEVDFDDLGPMQIDGLVNKPRIDLILRTHVELPPAMQAGIAEVFGRTCDGSGLVGKIFFQSTSTFPVSPLDEITRAGPGFSV